MHAFTTAILASATMAALAAADQAGPSPQWAVGPQLLVASPAVEFGAVAEFRTATDATPTLRPEIFINDDGRLGAGASVLWNLSVRDRLPAGQYLALGPRVVIHNTDDESWELGGIATWTIASTLSGQSFEALATAGIVRDRRHDDLDLGLGIGVAYLFAP